jgi:hypothetical protein
MPLATATMISPIMSRRVTFSAPPADSAPVNTVAPTIDGGNTPGQTLSVTSYGTWTGYPFPAFTFQWQDDLVDIVGATDVSLLIQPFMVSSSIRCRVIGTNRVSSASANSNSVFIVPVA